ncbi:MAG: 2-amino-4-hydroxy-6-hydroxymethyldihydropteridine diphosphokinase [Candidatus Neomarinimicrobiota bacterium]|jgi:2-amino-4-hydroxy-6-hydroxymethyldihydropteridine diphosphokinase|nr:2-amino-4-hydroxy-6-hydroxymethyldihydropteridine diphosphokinase [Candidatus Neomarinimicrobiota bacterium]MDD3966038.1 2-amino-4-hydroxy-6-hydroxymethyldihydropteridine diphosphokinase [Candidatus Neomarinimicrobiota bacterium]MDX9780478.1 2-amino-4-hydroxy-6-hydroxymethyldihydropteridine diphosphokinase [bacterium]
MDKTNYRPLYLGFGSNLGDPGHLVTRAIKEVASNPHIGFVKQSSLWRTQALYDLHQPDFVNAVVKYRSDLDPFELLDYLNLIETRFLRRRDPLRPKGPRTLDIDILFYGDLQIRDARLHIPHPRFHERKFILFPMAEIDVNYQVPGTSFSIADYIERCPDKSKVERI